MKRTFFLAILGIVILLNFSYADYFSRETLGLGLGSYSATEQVIEFSGTNIILGSILDTGDSVNAIMFYDTSNSMRGLNQKFSTNGSVYMDMVLDSNKIPYMIFSDKNNDNRTSVIKRDGVGRGFEGVAGFSTNSKVIRYPDILPLANGVIWAVFQELQSKAGSTSVSWLYEFNGSWSQELQIGVNSILTDIEQDSKGTVYIAYAEDDDKLIDIQVLSLGKTLTLNNYATDISQGNTIELQFEIADNDQMYISYFDDNNNELRGLTSSGGLRIPMGMIIASGAISDIDMKVDTNNVVYISYIDKIDKNDYIFVKKFNEQTKDRENYGIVGEGGYPALALDANNTLYIAYSDSIEGGKSTVKKLIEVITCFEALYSKNYTNASCIGIPISGIRNYTDKTIVDPNDILSGLAYDFQITIKNISDSTINNLSDIVTKLGIFRRSGPLYSKEVENIIELKGIVFKKDAFLKILDDL